MENASFSLYHRFRYISYSPAYRNFVNLLHSIYTKRNCTQSFSKYYLSKPKNQGLILDQIL